MCSRFALITPPGQISERYDVEEIPAIEPRYDIAPTQQVLVIRCETSTLRRQAAFLRWGIVPSWALSPTGVPLINARCETVCEKPAFRQAMRSRRCIVPASGYYEWASLDGKRKIPFHIGMRAEEPLALAGIWEAWKAPDGAMLESVAILTTVPNSLLAPLHDRMPVILHHAEVEVWLDREVEPEKLRHLYQPYPADLLEVHPVVRVTAQGHLTNIQPVQTPAPQPSLFHTISKDC